MLNAPTTFGGGTPAAPNVTDSKSIVYAIELGGAGVQLSAVIESVSGSDALTDFGVEFQGYKDGPWVGYLSGTDWASVSLAGMQFCTTQSPADLAAGESSGIVISVAGMFAVRFYAICATAETATIVMGGGVSGGGY